MNKRDATESTSTTTALIVVGALLLMGLPCVATLGGALFFYRAQAVEAPMQPPIVQPPLAPPAPAGKPAPVPEEK